MCVHFVYWQQSICYYAQPTSSHYLGDYSLFHHSSDSAMIVCVSLVLIKCRNIAGVYNHLIVTAELRVHLHPPKLLLKAVLWSESDIRMLAIDMHCE